MFVDFTYNNNYIYCLFNKKKTKTASYGRNLSLRC